MQRLFEFKILPSVWLFIKSERWLVVGFWPHATSAGVFGINLSTLVPIFGSFEGGAQRNEFICAMQRLFEFKILPSVWLFIKSERWLVVGFWPHATSAGVFGINLSTLVPIFGSFEGGAQRNESDNLTIMLYNSHLAIEVYNFKFWRSPWYSEGRIRGAIHAFKSDRTGSSL